MSGRIISKAEGWETVYQAFQNINFTAFDYQSIKQSMIDYLRLYFPETFNDFIESSEFIAIIETFAYLGEIMAYRVDMASHENFLPTAQRKQSVLRLAKLISYNVSRNIPARGLVKITSVSTTEPVYDARGVNLENTKINWNDPSNPNWKEHFQLVMDRVLQQPLGSVLPKDRVQVQDVLFELYALNNNPVTNGVIPFSVQVSGESYPMELVPVGLNQDGPYEQRPEINSTLKILYGSDGLGDGSSGTGFFSFAKQGTLQLVQQSFDGITPNQTYDVGISNINETDLWVNNVDPDNELQILVNNGDGPTGVKIGEWVPVDLAHAQNIIYNTNILRNKYEIETLENDNVRIIFGDGEFADIPSGLFHIWVRSSANADVVIPQTAVDNIISNVTYQDNVGITRTLAFSFSSVSTMQNASQAEDIEHIRRMAPSVYYTQDRMVNGRDYNTFMLQDQTVLKIRSFNRTFAGESNYNNYTTFNDASGAYDNVKIFGDDLALYLHTTEEAIPAINANTTTAEVVRNFIEPLLSRIDLRLSRILLGDPLPEQRAFSDEEFARIVADIELYRDSENVLYLYYNTTGWNTSAWDTAVWSYDPELNNNAGWNVTTDSTKNWYIKIGKFTSTGSWEVSYKSTKIIAESPTTRFWFSSQNKVINYDSLNPGNDAIILLKANQNKNRDGVATESTSLVVTDHNYVFTGVGPITDIGLPNLHQLSVMYSDTNSDNIPDIPLDSTGYYSDILGELIDPMIQVTLNEFNGTFSEAGWGYDWNVGWGIGGPMVSIPTDVPVYADTDGDGVDDTLIAPPPQYQTIPYQLVTFPFPVMYGDVIHLSGENNILYYTLDGNRVATVNSETIIDGLITIGPLSLSLTEYAYFTRPSNDSYWEVLPTTTDTLAYYVQSSDTFPEYTRRRGRYPFNFMWMHQTPNHHLIDPSTTNIIDTYIITRGYYASVRRWLDGYLPAAPTPPTPLDLKTSYSYLTDNKMISDTLVLHAGKFKILFGANAPSELQAKFKIIRSKSSTLTDNQIKIKVAATINEFFDISKWEFGETFYFSELSATIHASLPTDVDSVVLVPLYSSNYFGDLMQINSREDEVFISDATISDIDVISSISRLSIKQL